MTDKLKNQLDENFKEEEIEEEDINQIHEEYYEEQGDQEYEEQANQEEGQMFEVAFDIQMQNGSYILLMGKTEENKLIFRLVDKEDEAKPFYQNEFSLEELKEISSFFNNFNDESNDIDTIIKYLSENEKEISIIDDDCIKLAIIINGEETPENIDFILHKITFIIDGDEEEQNIENIQSDNDDANEQNRNENIAEVKEEILEEEMDNMGNEEGLPVKGNENGENENEDDIERENLEYNEDKNIQSSQQFNGNLTQDSTLKRENIKNLRETGLQTIIEDINENVKGATPVKEPRLENKRKISIINETNEENEEKEEEKNNEEKGKDIGDSRISMVIEELKDNLDSLGGAMNYIEQNEQEQNGNKNEIKDNDNDNGNNNIENKNLLNFKNEIKKTINSLTDNFNSQIKRQNEYFLKAQKDIKEANEKKIEEIQNELNKKNNELSDVKKLLEEKISNLESNYKNNITKLNEELKNIKNESNNNSNSSNRNIYSYVDKIKQDFNSKISEINQKIANLKNEINNANKNNRANDNINMNIKTFLDKINNLENRFRQNDENLKSNNNSINDKLKNFENKLKNADNNEKKILLDKFNNLENKFKNIDNAVTNLKNNNQMITPFNDKAISDKINNLEKAINDMKEKNNQNELNMNKNIEEIINSELITKVDNLMNWSKTIEDNFKKIETEMKSNDNYLDDVEKRLVKLENRLTHRNMLKQSLDEKKDKETREFFQKVLTNNEVDIRDMNINNNKSTVIKKLKKTKLTKSQNTFGDTQKNDEHENNTKNYRIIRVVEDTQFLSKKYASHTYNRGNIASSHSMNRMITKQNNNLDKNDDYDVTTRPRSKSKEFKKKQQRYKQENENFSDTYSSKKKISKSKNIHTNEFENGINKSKIIQHDDIIFLENRIKKIYPKLNINFNLVYRATEDGDRAANFHNKCDKIGPNVTFVKTKTGYVFGGFTVKNWEHLKRDINDKKPNLGSASRDSRAFGFCVNYQKIYKNEKPNEFAIWCNRNFGPTFKNNFFQIFDNFFKRGGYCSSKNNSNFGGQDHDYEISGGEAKFGVEEIEVFEISFH